MNYNEIRRKTKEIQIGRVKIGGTKSIAVQSMTNTPTEDREKTYKQVKALEGGKIRQRGLGETAFESQFLNCFCKSIGKIGVRFHGRYIR